MEDKTSKIVGRVMLDDNKGSQEAAVTVQLEDGDLGREVIFSTSEGFGGNYLVVGKADLLRVIEEK